MKGHQRTIRRDLEDCTEAAGPTPLCCAVEASVGLDQTVGSLTVGAVRLRAEVVERSYYASRAKLENRALAICTAAERSPVEVSIRPQ